MALLGIVSIRITTNYLSSAGYGEYNAVYDFLAFFGIAADLGLFTIAVREMAKENSNIEKIIGNTLSLRTILVFITMLAAIVAVFLIPKYENTRVPLGVAVSSLTVVLTILNGTISSVLQAKLKMHLATIATLVGKIISVGAMAYVVFFGFPNDKEIGFYLLLGAGILGNLIMTIATDYYVRKITPLKYRFDFDFWKDVLVKALPYGLALIFNTIYFRMNSVLIFFFKGAEETGIYAVAMRMLEQIIIVPLFFMNSVLPVLTRAIQEKTAQYKTIISYSFDFLAAMAMPLTVGGFLLAYPIVFVISKGEYLSRLSEGFYGSDIAIQILIIALLFQFLNTLFAFILVAINRQSKLLYVNMGVVIFNLILDIFLIPRFGFRGAAFASVISELFILIATAITARHYLEYSINIKNIIKIIISSAVMGVAIYFFQPITYAFMQNWNLFVLVPLSMIIYALMLFVTKTINKEMLALLRKKEPPVSENGTTLS